MNLFTLVACHRNLLRTETPGKRPCAAAGLQSLVYVAYALGFLLLGRLDFKVVESMNFTEQDYEQ
jgi:hypothetical protein